MCTVSIEELTSEEIIPEVLGYKVLLKVAGGLWSPVFPLRASWSATAQEAFSLTDYRTLGSGFHIFKWYYQALLYSWWRHEPNLVIKKVRGTDIDQIGRAYCGRVYIARFASLAED